MLDVSEKTRKWASSHKCRKCNKGLSLSRYFNCEDCVRLETQDEWDSFDDHDFEYANGIDIVTAKKKDAEALDMFIKCRKCDETHPRTDFNYARSNKSGRSTMCRHCDAKRHREYRALKKLAS